MSVLVAEMVVGNCTGEPYRLASGTAGEENHFAVVRLILTSHSCGDICSIDREARGL
jgi:hypothetical protein